MPLLQTLFAFEGRINRATFWSCLAAVLLLNLAVLLGVQAWIAEVYPDAAGVTAAGGGLLGVGLVMLILLALSVWAGLALGIKRLRDRGKGGLWLLAGLVPVFGGLWLLWDLGLAPGLPDKAGGGSSPPTPA